MLDYVIRYSVSNKLIILLLTLVLIVWGSWSLSKLPIDAVPDITNNQVQIITNSSSLGPLEIEKLISYPIEVNMINIPGVQEVRSISRFGLSLVTVVFDDDIDIYWARQQITERLNKVKSVIPSPIGTPELAPVSTGLSEIYQYTLFPTEAYKDKYSITDLRTIQDWIVRRQLLATKGIADISSFGGKLKQIEVAIDPHKIRSYNISLSEIFDALEKNNQNGGGSYIDKRPNIWYIRTEGEAKTLEDINKIVVKTLPNGSPVLIKNVAKVRIGSAIRYGAITRNTDGEVVGGIVLMLKGENSKEVIKAVKSSIEEIKKTLPEGIEIQPYIDRTKLVDKAIHTVTTNLIEGALIVIFVLVLLIGNIRAGVIVASVIPLAMLFAVGMMNVFSISGNLMSLGAIDFGIIVDGSVIIVEATIHYLSTQNNGLLSKSQMDEAVIHAASKIRKAASFGEIIILIVYLPILALTGVEGKMFKPMAMTVSFAIIGAFILSLTYVPMMSAWFLRPNLSLEKSYNDRFFFWLQNKYTRVLSVAIDFKHYFISVAILMLGISLWILTLLGGEFIPTLEEGDLAIETRILTGSSIEETIETATKSAQILIQNFPEVIQVIGKIGTSEIPTDPMPLEACDLIVELKDKSEWTSAETTQELVQKMNEKLSVIAGASFSFQQPIQMRFNELMTGAKQDIAIKIYGEDLQQLLFKSLEVKSIVKDISGVEDVFIAKSAGLPQIVISYDRDKLAKYGISIAEANRYITMAFAGQKAGNFYEGEKIFDLVIRLDSSFRNSITDLNNIYIYSQNGEPIPINLLAKIEIKQGPNQIDRENTMRRAVVSFNVRNRDIESVIDEIKPKLASLKLLPGYRYEIGGQFKNLEDAKKRLAIALPIALLLIFGLLYFTFYSVNDSLLIFTAVPFSAIGGILALWFRDMAFSISAGVGFITLFGVSVLNGIVLISEFKYLEKQTTHFELKDLVLKGVASRIRPVLMTALVASLGFLPMSLATGSGAEIQKPLATVVIGGLVSSTILTLFILPMLYILIHHKKSLKSL